MSSQKFDLSPLIRFLEVLPKSGDTELALLKSHLVIEEVLTKIIYKNVAQEKYISEAKLSFYQKCKIARSINEIASASWVWQALKLLNQARNELSHNLTREELDIKLESFTSHVKVHNHDLFSTAPSQKFTNFHMAAFATYIVLASFANFDPAKVKVPTLLGSQNA